MSPTQCLSLFIAVVSFLYFFVQGEQHKDRMADLKEMVETILEGVQDLPSIDEVREELLARHEASSPATHKTSRRLLLHSRPSAKGHSTKLVIKGQDVSVLRIEGKWAFVSVMDEDQKATQSGWLYVRYLRPLDTKR